MESIDWSSFKLRIPVNSSVEEAMGMWLSAEKMESWFLSGAKYFTNHGGDLGRTGGVFEGVDYEWEWFGYDVTERGRVLSFNSKDEISFTFGGPSVVTVRIYEEEGEVIIDLKQEKIPLDEKSRFNVYYGCSIGWTFYLTNLKSILEGGPDLRNKNEKIKNVFNH